MATITWPQLIVLTCFGDGTDDSISGEIHVRSVVQVPDDDDAENPDVTDHPRLGRVRIEEYTGRVHRRGDLVRRERPDGEPRMITGADTFWIWFDGDEQPTAYPRAGTSWGHADAVLVERPETGRWEGNDFTRLTGPIEATEYLGRPAWAFELAPPPHKPYPLQMVIDAETGLVLRQANEGFDSVWEWTSLRTGVDLRDELFVWNGPVKEPEDWHEAHERDMAVRRAWLASRGIDAPALTVRPELIANQWDDTDGSFYASFDLNLFGAIARRPVSDAPWPVVDNSNYPHAERWVDGAWEFFVSSTVPLPDADLVALKARLAAST